MSRAKRRAMVSKAASAWMTVAALSVKVPVPGVSWAGRGITV
jgi:hypothetical protein